MTDTVSAIQGALRSMGVPEQFCTERAARTLASVARSFDGEPSPVRVLTADEVHRKISVSNVKRLGEPIALHHLWDAGLEVCEVKGT